ncbi:MAG: hypothetical protein ACOZBH_05440 [Patescibacteria group bacterium]
MSLPEEVNSLFFVMKAETVCGVFTVLSEKNVYASYFQPHPGAKFSRVEDLEKKKADFSLRFCGAHARSVFDDTCQYFANRDMCVRTDRSAVTMDNYRESMWALFSKHFLKKEIIEAIRKRCQSVGEKKASWSAKTEIGFFYLINPTNGEQELVGLWEQFFNEWFPY